MDQEPFLLVIVKSLATEPCAYTGVGVTESPPTLGPTGPAGLFVQVTKLGWLLMQAERSWVLPSYAAGPKLPAVKVTASGLTIRLPVPFEVAKLEPVLGVYVAL